ncbi:MAG: YfiR family protein [Burkholderiales bacterium]
MLLANCLSFSQVVAYAQVPEYDLKAAFVYNVALFTDWPADSFSDKEEGFNFCVAGADPFGNTLDSLTAKLLKQRKINIVRLGKSSSPGRCHILFIPATENIRADSLFKEVKNSSVLTVSEDISTFKKGSMLNLSIIENKLRFQVNMDAVSTARLSISSKLLRLADSVQKEKE